MKQRVLFSGGSFAKEYTMQPGLFCVTRSLIVMTTFAPTRVITFILTFTLTCMLASVPTSYAVWADNSVHIVVTERAQEDTTDRVSNRILGGTPERMSDRTPGRIPKRIPKRMSERVSERVLERMPEQNVCTSHDWPTVHDAFVCDFHDETLVRLIDNSSYEQYTPGMRAVVLASISATNSIDPALHYWLQQRANNTIVVDLYIKLAPDYRIDPILALAQAALETAWFRSWWAVVHHNYAGLWVNGSVRRTNPTTGYWVRRGSYWIAGRSFMSEEEGVRAHLALLGQYCDRGRTTITEIGSLWATDPRYVTKWKQIVASFPGYASHETVCLP